MTEKHYNNRIDQQIAVWIQRQEALKRGAVPPTPEDQPVAMEYARPHKKPERLP